MIVAIDGPAGAGKSTIAKLIAKKLGFLYIDTGAMYRAVTLKAIEKGADPKDPRQAIRFARNSDIALINRKNRGLKVLLDGKDVSAEIRQPIVTRYVSDIAKVRGVRLVMLKLQRKLGKSGDCVMDGRDIGTIVFPDAKMKFYLDADFRERVSRRYKEMKAAGIPKVTLKSVSADLKNRDNIDSTRKFAPLKMAKDAIYLDTTNMEIAEVVSTLQKIIRERNG